MVGWVGVVGIGCFGDDDRRDVVKGFWGGKRVVGGSIDRCVGFWGLCYRRDGDIFGRFVVFVYDYDVFGDVGCRFVVVKNYWLCVERMVVCNKVLCSDVMFIGYVF